MIKIALALALSITAIPAFAADGNWQVGNHQIHVIDSTIDIATPEGRMRLLARVERAAAKLCRDRSFRRQCELDTVRQTAAANTAWGRALALSLDEHGAVQMAAR